MEKYNFSVAFSKRATNNFSFNVNSCFREEGQTFGTYLMIANVLRDDLGQYVCIISKPGKTVEKSVWVREHGKKCFIVYSDVFITGLKN